MSKENFLNGLVVVILMAAIVLWAQLLDPPWWQVTAGCFIFGAAVAAVMEWR